MTRWQANGLLLLASVIWGSAFVAQVLGMDGVGPLAFTGLRFLLGAAVVAPLAWREWGQLRARDHRPGAREWRQVGLLGALLTAGVVMQQFGLMATTVTNAGFLTALYVPLVPIIAWLVHRERPDWIVWPAALGCLTGTWLLAGGATLDIGRGDAWVIASSLPWAFHVLWVGRVANRMRGAYLLACAQFLVCGLVATAAGLALEPVSWDGLRVAAGAIAYTGVLSVGVAFTLQVVGQRHAPPADAAILLSSETLFAALFGAWLMGDRLGPAGLAGCATILGSILLVQLHPLLAARRR
ncbi:DMT family transporter [Ideonella alba]|uniref:DMT family transporter n=1 Tax=Ideonella alba TaxID=2824118 RepID=A0A940Y782_9BURK|nr:DMT family transporter [Ideonella alba]MBQ0931389.1 DMT family transporter [Ideonella alba]